jgi:hypothetical protein
MNPNAVLVFKYDGDMFFNLIEHHGEDIKNIFLGSSNQKVTDSNGCIMGGSYRKNGKIYSVIAFEGGTFEDLLHYNNVAWDTYLNYGVLFEFIDDGTKIKMSFFRDEHEPVNTSSQSMPDQKIWIRHPNPRCNNELALPPNSGEKGKGGVYV